MAGAWRDVIAHLASVRPARQAAPHQGGVKPPHSKICGAPPGTMSVEPLARFRVVVNANRGLRLQTEPQPPAL